MVSNIIESKVAKGWVFFNENWTVDVNWLKEYTIKCAYLNLSELFTADHTIYCECHSIG